MSSARKFVWLGVVCLSLVAPNAGAQPAADQPAPPPGGETQAPAAGAEAQGEGGAERAAFDAAFGKYKQAIAAIEALRSEYQTANETRRREINQELRQLIAGSQPLVDTMVDSGVALFRVAPDADPKVRELLLGVAEFSVRGSGKKSQGGDDYERALQVVQALEEGGVSDPRFYVWGAISAYATNQFDLAEDYARRGQEAGAWAPPSNEKDTVGQELFALANNFVASVPQYRKLWEKEQELRKAEAEADNLPRVKLTTTKGEIVIELFEDQAPNTVANFISLVKQGFYSNTKFHRVLPRFMAQGGDPKGTGMGGPGYTVPCECYRKDARMHFRGTLSMAHAGRDTGGSQFFLTFVPTDHLNGRHTAFGRVVEGMPVLARLIRVDPGEMNMAEDKILKAEVLRDRGHSYEFKKS